MDRLADRPCTVGELIARLQRCDPSLAVHSLYLVGPTASLGNVHVVEDDGQRRVYLRHTTIRREETPGG